MWADPPVLSGNCTPKFVSLCQHTESLMMRQQGKHLWLLSTKCECNIAHSKWQLANWETIHGGRRCMRKLLIVYVSCFLKFYILVVMSSRWAESNLHVSHWCIGIAYVIQHCHWSGGGKNGEVAGHGSSGGIGIADGMGWLATTQSIASHLCT